MLGLHCCVWAFSSCKDWGLFSSCGVGASHCSGLSSCGVWALGARASVVVECVLSRCGAWTLLPNGTWDFPGLGIEPMSPALASGFLTTGCRGSPKDYIFLEQRANLGMFGAQGR